MKYRLRYRRHSLAARLIWIFITIATITVVLVGGTMGLAFKHGFEENLRPHLVRYLEYVQNDIGSPPDKHRARELTERLPIEIHIFTLDEVWSSKAEAPDLASIEYKHSFEQNGASYQLGEYQDREYLLTQREDYTLAFSIPRTRGPIYWRLGIPIAILLIVLMLLHHLTRKLFQPIESLKAGVERIGQGELDYRVRINRRDELGELAVSVNAMADDIQQMLEAKRQLLLAISHELRSPITRAKVSAEMLDDEDQRKEIGRELDVMEQLIEELLETERLSTHHRILNRSEISINRLIKELIEQNFDTSSMDLLLPNEEVLVNVDAVRIKLLLKNLLDNAIRHSASEHPPRLTAEVQGDTIYLAVRDYGRGIEEHHLPYLTEPFYRVDAARQRQTGGFGLGLYLCRMIAEAHGGSLQVKNAIGRGVEIEVRLPLKSME